MKTVREYYQQCLEAEKAAFLNVMKAVPAGKAGYTPHPRSTTAGDLLWLLATELDDACTLGDMLFGFLFDAIHHREQLSSYLRPMGAKVPAIYGPSGDDPGT